MSTSQTALSFLAFMTVLIIAYVIYLYLDDKEKELLKEAKVEW